MTIQQRVEIMFNLVLYPEVTDVFVQEHCCKDTRYVSATIKVGDYESCVAYEAPVTECANKIICVMDRKVRNAINELKEKLQ